MKSLLLAMLFVAQALANDGPLFLTPLIKSSKNELARNLSLVTFNDESLAKESYSGFLTVNQSCNSNLFFWLFKADKNRYAPTILWLQGPPGESSLFGLFVEHGPFKKGTSGRLERRKEFDWTTKFNVIYIDNPVGAGFSFTDKEECYARNQDQVGGDLFEALQQLFTLFPEIQKNDFWVVGESYGGKFAPAIAHTIHQNKDISLVKNMKGMIIGDGWMDPVSQAYYSDFLFQISLITLEESKFMRAEQDRYIELINQGKFVEALHVFAPLVDGPNSWLKNITGFNWFNNFLNPDKPEDDYNYKVLLEPKDVRTAIHVGDLKLSDGSKVGEHLQGDIMASVKPWVEEIMNNYRVLFYNGQLDIVVASPLTENFIRTIDWVNAEDYKNVQKGIWKVNPKDKQIAGYLKKVGNGKVGFNRAIVRNAGHNAIYDQPRVLFSLIDGFIHQRC